MAKRESYSEEFKHEALEKWQSSGQSAAEIETELDISKGSLSRWKRELATESDAGSTPDLGEEKAQEPDAAAGEAVEESTPSDSEGGEQGDKELESKQIDEGSLTGPDSDDAASESDDVAVISPEEETSPHRPSLVKRIAGIVAIIFGGLGVILSIVAIVAVWVVNKPITDTSVEVLVTVEAALDVVEENLIRADEALQTVRDGIAETAAQIPTDGLLEVVDNINSLVEAAQSTADTASSIFGVANSIPFLGPSQSQEESSGAKLDELSATLDQISTGLTTVEERLKGLSEGGAEGGLLNNIDQDIAGFQSELNRVEGNVNEVGTVVQEITVSVPRWIDVASVIITLLIIWLGVAQYSLLAHGWSWVRGV